MTHKAINKTFLLFLFCVGEADAESSAINAGRASNGKQEKPSDILKIIEDGITQITDTISEGVEK